MGMIYFYEENCIQQQTFSLFQIFFWADFWAALNFQPHFYLWPRIISQGWPCEINPVRLKWGYSGNNAPWFSKGAQLRGVYVDGSQHPSTNITGFNVPAVREFNCVPPARLQPPMFTRLQVPAGPCETCTTWIDLAPAVDQVSHKSRVIFGERATVSLGPAQ